MTVVGLHGEGSNMEIFDNLARNVKVKFRRVLLLLLRLVMGWFERLRHGG